MSSSACRSMASPRATTLPRRSAGLNLDHVLKAARALSTARFKSDAVETGTGGLGLRVAGLRLWRVADVVVSSLLIVL